MRRRRVHRFRVVFAALTILTASCGGDTAATTTIAATTTTTTSTTTTSTSTTTTTTIPSGPAIIGEGDRGIWVETLQSLLNCAGYADLETDGVYGPRTSGAVAQAQEAHGRSLTGEPDDEVFGLVSRECDRHDVLDLEGEGTVQAAGNAAADDPDRFSLGVQRGSVITLRVDPAVTLTVEGEAGDSLSAGDGLLTYESPAAQVATIVVTAPSPTTYLLRVDLAPPGSQPEPETPVVEGPFVAGDWVGMEWSGRAPGGLIEFGSATDCVGEDADSPCHGHFGVIVARPGSFTGSGAENPIEAMGWLLRDTGVEDGEATVWEIAAAVVFEAPIGDTVLDDCYPQGGDRNLVAHADPGLGTVTAALRWDWVTREIEVIPPDRIVCVDASGDHVAVGPGFG